jgi:hypothetical protein
MKRLLMVALAAFGLSSAQAPLHGQNLGANVAPEGNGSRGRSEGNGSRGRAEGNGSRGRSLSSDVTAANGAAETLKK